MKTTVAPDGTVTVETEPVAKTTWDGETTRQTVLKSEVERRYTLSVGYPADMVDIGIARDGHRDFANPEAVEKAAWNYLDSAREVGLRHEDGSEGHGRVVESYLAPVDMEFGEQKVCKGDWLIGIQWDEPTWDEIKAGHINGTSMQGRALRRTPNPADLARVLNRGR
jgi:Putative phage serine protease XkdF